MLPNVQMSDDRARVLAMNFGVGRKAFLLTLYRFESLVSILRSQMHSSDDATCARGTLQIEYFPPLLLIVSPHLSVNEAFHSLLC